MHRSPNSCTLHVPWRGAGVQTAGIDMTAQRETQLPYNAQKVMAAGPLDARETEYRIDGVRGLVLRVRPNRQGVWYFYYRAKVGEGHLERWALKKLKLDDREHMTLSEARKRAEELQVDVNKGSDPQAAREVKRLAVEKAKADRAAKTTFRQLFELRMAKDNSITESTKIFYRATLEASPDGHLSILDQLGSIPADELTPQQIVAVLDKIEARGATVAVDHAKAAISATYKWALKRQSVAANPTAGLGKRYKAEPRERDVTPADLKTLWEATDRLDIPLSKSMRLIIKLAVLCGQRRTEVAGALKSELSLDGLNPTWTIAGDTKQRGRKVKRVKGRTKNAQKQVLPLSKQAVALWREALKLSQGVEHVFPADTMHVKKGKTPKTPHINGQSVTTAMRRIRAATGLEDITIHDTRRAIGSWFGDNGVRPDVIERVLNHTPQDVTRRHYNHSTLEPLVRPAMQAWADNVDRVVTDSTAEAKVVSIGRASEQKHVR